MRNATRVFASTFGAIMALAGLEHGAGEILQGNVAPAGIMILSWPDAPFFRNLAGEPAMTLVPNLLLTGILAVIASLALMAWSVLFVQRKHGGWVMVLLSVALLLVGGGIFPPVLGALVGGVATRINAPAPSKKARQPDGIQRFLVKLWPFSYAICILAWFAMFPAAYFFGERYPQAIVAVLLMALGTLVLTMVSGFAKDRLSHAVAPA
jgi:hypothetical protein